MREPENIRDVAALGVDWIGFIFYPKSPRYVSQIRSRAGIIPDYSVFMKHEELSSKELSSSRNFFMAEAYFISSRTFSISSISAPSV